MTTAYLPADQHPECQCWPSLMAAMFCLFGNMTECHYPMTCDEAECAHYQQAQQEQDDGLTFWWQGEEEPGP